MTDSKAKPLFISRFATLMAMVAALATPWHTSTAFAGTTEKTELSALYERAKMETGPLTIYMGGDAPGQWDSIGKAFTEQYPDVELKIVVDLSKYHNARIENQIATNKLVADIAILQTLQDFDRWKKEGKLLRYKSVGWSKIYSFAKDPDGYWTGAMYFAFTSMMNKQVFPSDPAVFKATDLLDPKFKDKIILTYPNDDDAVLYGFKLMVEKYGWDWLAGIAAQNPTLVRGVPGSSGGVASGKYLASIATAAMDNEIAPSPMAREITSFMISFVPP
jgi:ABC-type Fe3+ transport system substrate-binding protein